MKNLTSTAAVLAAAALSACGGGSADTTGTSNEQAEAYAADASYVTEDAMSTMDAAVAAAQAVVAVQATAAVPMQALSAGAQPQAVASVPVACPGGGSASLSIGGGTVASVLNGQLNAGETYTLVYAACRGTRGALALDGTLTLAVNDAGTGRLSLTLGASALSAALPRGRVSLDGSLTESLSESTDASGVTTRSSTLQASRLALATSYSSRASRFTLSALNLSRTSTWVGGVQQASRYSGTHHLDAVLPRASFGYTVSTNGEVSYDASGNPVSGRWTVTLARGTVVCSVAGGLATITLDDDGDGVPERTWTVPVATLSSAAG